MTTDLYNQWGDAAQALEDWGNYPETGVTCWGEGYWSKVTEYRASGLLS